MAGKCGNRDPIIMLNMLRIFVATENHGENDISLGRNDEVL